MTGLAVEGLFRPNDSLTETVLDAMKEKGHRFFERMYMSLRLRALSDDKRLELERALTERLMEDVKTGAVTIPPAAIVGGVFVEDWRELFEWIIEHWPEILEMIIAIISLF